MVSLLREKTLEGMSPYPGNPLQKETAPGRKQRPENKAFGQDIALKSTKTAKSKANQIEPFFS